MRAFVAVNLPAAERERLYDALAPLRARALPVRWVEPQSLHLTLKFLGRVDEQCVAPVRTAVADVARRSSPFALRVAGLGAFPRMDRPRVWWVGVEPEPELLAVQCGLEATFEALGFAREERPFSPHVTVGHAAGRKRPARIHVPDLAATFPFHARIEVRSIDLMESHLSQRAARYSCVCAAPLGARAAPSMQTAEA